MGVYIINLDEYESIGTHSIALYVNDNNVIILLVLGFNIFQKKLIANRNIIRNIYRIQAYDSIMCGCFCIGLLKSKSLLKYTNLFSPNDYEQNDKIILKLV